MQNNNFYPENANSKQESLQQKAKRRAAHETAKTDNDFYEHLEQERLDGRSYYATHKPLFRMLKRMRVPANLLSMFFAIFGISAIITWFVTSNTYIAFGIGAVVAMGMQWANSSAIETWAKTYFNPDTPKEWARIPFLLAVFTLSITLFFGITGVMYSEEFNAKIVQRISNNAGIAPPTLNTNDLDTQISEKDKLIGKIEAEQKEYKALNKGKSATWLKADELAKAETDREKLTEQRTELLRGGKATAQQTAANSLSNIFISVILLLVLVCEAFVAITRIYPYYFKREVLAFDGDRINVRLEQLDTRKGTVYAPVLSQDEWKRQETIAAAVEQERQRELERDKQQGKQAPTSKINKLGFEYSQRDKKIITAEDSASTIEKPASTANNSVSTVESADLDSENDNIKAIEKSTLIDKDNNMLLELYRHNNSELGRYRNRITDTAKEHKQMFVSNMDLIQEILKERGKRIMMINKAYRVVDII